MATSNLGIGCLGILAALGLVAAGTIARATAEEMRPQCLVREQSSWACMDGTLTSRATARVMRYVDEPPGHEPPEWTIQFQDGGVPVVAKIVDWPPPPGTLHQPKLGDLVTVAYAPAAPGRFVAPADALDGYRAKAKRYEDSRWPAVLDGIGYALMGSAIFCPVAVMTVRSRRQERLNPEFLPNRRQSA